MNEEKKGTRTLQDISHYFISTEEDKTTNDSSQAVAIESQHLFVIGSNSFQARAIVASNLACQWSQLNESVELIESEKSIQNAHFLMGGLIPEKCQGNQIKLDLDQLITLTKWNPNLNGHSYLSKRVIWNVPLSGVVEIVAQLKEAPQILVVLENKTSKLIEVYLELRQLIAIRPELKLFSLVYSNQSCAEAEKVITFFQDLVKQFLYKSIQNSGVVKQDLVLSESLLKRVPIVLEQEGSVSKETFVKLTETL